MTGKSGEAEGLGSVTPRECFLLDPSLFTLPYDLAVCEALIRGGYRPTLLGRQRRSGEREDAPFVRSCFPDPLASRGYGSRLRKIAKASIYPLGWMSALRLLKPAASVLNIQWMPFPAVDLRVLASLRHRHPILYTAHDTMMGNTSTAADPTADLLRRLDPDLIVVHTRQGLTRLMGRGFDESRLFLVPHPPLALPPAAAAPQDIQAEKAVFQIAMIGEVKAYKGYDTAFKALAALPEDIARRIRFQVSGRPFFDVEALRDQLLPPSRRDLVRFDLRYLSEEEFGRALDETDCLLLPYQEIEASGVLYTALARARMILASDVGAFGEILPEEYLVPVADDAALARKLIDLVSQPDARAARAERLREVARVHLSGSEFDSRLLAAFDLAGQKFRARVSRP